MVNTCVFAHQLNASTVDVLVRLVVEVLGLQPVPHRVNHSAVNEYRADNRSFRVVIGKRIKGCIDLFLHSKPRLDRLDQIVKRRSRASIRT